MKLKFFQESHAGTTESLKKNLSLEKRFIIYQPTLQEIHDESMVGRIHLDRDCLSKCDPGPLFKP